MPFKAIDYTKAVIYKIQHLDIDELLYVGSTCDFVTRKCQHKRACNNTSEKYRNILVYQMIRDNGGWDKFNMVVIPTEPCNTKMELLTLEDSIMRKFKSNMNTNRAHIPPEEVCERNKEYNKQYYSNNAELLNEKQKQYNKKNAEHIKSYKKEYYNNNAEQLKEQHKQYYIDNTEQIKNKKKQYYIDNIEQFAIKSAQKVECDVCSKSITTSSLNRHKKSIKCKSFLKIDLEE